MVTACITYACIVPVPATGSTSSIIEDALRLLALHLNSKLRFRSGEAWG